MMNKEHWESRYFRNGPIWRDNLDSLQGKCLMFRYIITLSKIDVAVRVVLKRGKIRPRGNIN